MTENACGRGEIVTSKYDRAERYDMDERSPRQPFRSHIEAVLHMKAGVMSASKKRVCSSARWHHNEADKPPGKHTSAISVDGEARLGTRGSGFASAVRNGYLARENNESKTGPGYLESIACRTHHMVILENGC
jgi:hypothetical protein